jgi:cyclopropane fatty-acyl-phospholipid synthase-like methyltransferase
VIYHVEILTKKIEEEKELIGEKLRDLQSPAFDNLTSLAMAEFFKKRVSTII